MSPRGQKKFRGRFSREDWEYLCTKREFLDALIDKPERIAEAVAADLLRKRVGR